MPLSEFDIALGFKMVELPFDEGAVEWVCVSSNKRSSPVSVDTKILEISLALRWKERRPIVGILESRDFLIWNA